jgi:hypothetical protein
MTALWDTAPCSLVEVDVSEVRNVSIIRVMNNMPPSPPFFSPEGVMGLVPKRGCLLTLAYYAFLKWYEFGKRQWNDIQTGENRRTRRKTCPSATLSTTNPTWIDTGANPGLRGERPATNDLSHGTAFRPLLPDWCLSSPYHHPHFPTGLAKIPSGLTDSYISSWFFMHGLFIAVMMETVHPWNIGLLQETTWNHIQESCHLHTCLHENLKSHMPTSECKCCNITFQVTWLWRKHCFGVLASNFLLEMVTLVSLANIMGSGKECTVLLEEDHLYIPYYEKQGPQNWSLWKSVFYCFPGWEENVCF